MARIEGTQSIPATWLDAYRATLTEKLPTGAARKRYPFRIPLKQEGGYKVTANQQRQRNRWLAIKAKFKTLDLAARQRWWTARPVWNSLLWYFNYFMMSGLMGNAVVGDKGGGVIKDIYHYTFTLPSGAAPDATIVVDACDPLKSVPFFFGAGVEVIENVPVAIYPYLKSLASTQMVVGASMALDFAATLSVSLIEYI